MATISNTPRPGYAWDATDNVWYPIGTGTHGHSDYITQASAINPTIVDAKGDIIAASAADTVARLAVGANDTVLTADSTAGTGLKWATPSSGGMTLISTTTLTGASVTVSSIPATYNNVYIVVRSFLPATDGAYVQMRVNADATASRHRNNYNWGEPATGTFAETFVQIGAGQDNTVTNGICTVFIPDYTNTTTWKTAIVSSATPNLTTTTSLMSLNSTGYYNQIGAVSSLQFLCNTGNLTSGSVLLYGVK